MPELERHHLIPRTRHSNKKNKRRFARRDVHGRVAWLCGACHEQIHALLTPKELEYDYNSLEALAAHGEMAKFLSWIRAKPFGRTYRARSGRRRTKARSVGKRRFRD